MAVNALRLCGTDEPAAKAVVRAQERFPGPAAAQLPDLMVLWNNSRPFDAIESGSIGRIENRDPATRSSHSSRGAMFACGPLIAPGAMVHGRDFDIAPTVLKLLDTKVPRRLDGAAVTQLIAHRRKRTKSAAAELIAAGSAA